MPNDALLPDSRGKPCELRSLALSSPLLTRSGFAHGFFMRAGGSSPAPWASLNFSSGSGDAPENVAANVALAAAALGVPPSQVHFLSQVHGTVAQVLLGDENPRQTLYREGDATLSSVPGIACGVRSADCGTLLVGDPSSGAVCAIHAGWRGTVRGVVERGIEALVAHAGCRTETLVVAVGPLIEECCFEVGEDVAVELAGASTARESVVVRTDGTKPHVDLRRVLDAKLAALGVLESNVDHVRGCTVCDPGGRFFSFRREGAVSGRMLAAIVARAPAQP